MDPNGPAHAGYLVKLARYSKRNWKKRWFTLTLTPQCLCYFKSKTDSKEAGRIDMDATTKTQKADLPKRPNCFRISNSSYGDLFVQATSKEDMEVWMKKIAAVARGTVKLKQVQRRKSLMLHKAGMSPIHSSQRATGLKQSLATLESNSSTNANSNTSSAVNTPKFKRSTKVLLTLEKFLADRPTCRKYYTADHLLIGAQDPLNFEELFPEQKATNGQSEALKLLLQGMSIEDVEITNVRTDDHRSNRRNLGAGEAREVFQV